MRKVELILQEWRVSWEMRWVKSHSGLQRWKCLRDSIQLRLLLTASSGDYFCRDLTTSL